MSKYITENIAKDGIDRRGFLHCMAWARHGRVGFKKDANPDVIGTLRAAIGQINSLPAKPSFLIHTGDISHLSKPEEFDAVDQILKGARVGQSFLHPRMTGTVIVGD